MRLVLNDSSLFQSFFDLFPLKPHDHFIPDKDRRGGPPPGLPDQFIQVLRIFDYVFLDEGDAFF